MDRKRFKVTCSGERFAHLSEAMTAARALSGVISPIVDVIDAAHGWALFSYQNGFPVSRP